MEIYIKNCNNIETAKITIAENKLNIKFAPNGTGKSTISKAIQFAASSSEQDLVELMPFRLRENNLEKLSPEVLGVDGFSSIMCFNEDYVNQFTFQPDEVVSNSFDIFIRSDSYKELETEIAGYVQTVQQQFENNPELDLLIENMMELSKAFRITKNGSLSKASTGVKGLSSGNKIDNIPFGLEPYKPFIQSSKNISWIDWQTKGFNEFSELSESCPFCIADVSAEEKKELVAKISQEYDRNLVKNLLSILDVVEKLGDFLSDEAREKLRAITLLEDGIKEEHEEYIVTVKKHIDILVGKLEDLRTLSGFDFKEGEKIGEQLIGYEINLEFLDAVNSKKTDGIVKAINQSLGELMQQAGKLQGNINRQRREINNLIERHQTNINDFLNYAGYQYEVEIVGEGEQTKLKLRHIDSNAHLSGGSQHLSFGERNAFSIVLFMYECLSKNPDLIILDDPISSFDKNKKYAILEMLFRRDAKDCLKSKTVLMLTHDVEPIIDTLRSVSAQFDNQVNASYLRLDAGNITEQTISGNDIKSFVQICQDVFDSDHDPIIKLIYLRRRYEVLDDREDGYQILSNLFKKREFPEDFRIPKNEDGSSELLSPDAISNGINGIKELIHNLPDCYLSLLELFTNDERINELYHNSNNGYEKLQLTRLLLGAEKNENSVIRKFINETYHIENEFIFQLNPMRYDLIPEYIVKECDKILAVRNEG